MKKHAKSELNGRQVISASAFKARCLKIIDEASKGHEYIITKRGKPLVVLAPLSRNTAKIMGAWKGLVEIQGEIVHTDWSEAFKASRDD